jgi:acyl carrier protein
MLAEITRRPELAEIGPDAELFGEVVGLDSLSGTVLLRQIELRYGVDVAAEDLSLDALATVRTLAAFIAERV